MEFPECGRFVRVELKKKFGGVAISGKTADAPIFFEGCCILGCVFFSRETFTTHVESWEYE